MPDLWGWSERPIDRTSRALGQLDFIGAFASHTALQLEAFLTPVVRCLESRSNGQRRCVAIARLGQGTVSRRFKLQHIQSVAVAGIHNLDGPSPPLNVAYDLAFIEDRPPTQYCAQFIDISDERSDCLPFGDLRRRNAQIAAMINTWSPCPDSVGFFIVEDDLNITIIPTGTILQACYMPLALAKHLEDGASGPGFSSDQRIFNGYRFGGPYLRYFPIKARRNLERAEHEVQQIVPRALAYYKLNGNFAPLLVRPPFVGRATVNGWGFRQGIDGRNALLFTSGVEFYSAVDAAVRRAKFDRAQDLSFAPHLYRAFGLSNAGGRNYLGRGNLHEPEFCDVHYFKRIERRVADEVARGYRVYPPPTTRAALDLRKWCAGSIASRRRPPYPDPCLPET